MAEKSDLLLKEFDAARTRIEKEIDQINYNEIAYTTLFIAVLTAGFSFKIENIAALKFQSVLLVLIPVYAWARYGAHRRIVMLHELYIKWVIEYVFYQVGCESIETAKKDTSETESKPNRFHLPNGDPSGFDRTHGMVAFYDKFKSASNLSELCRRGTPTKLVIGPSVWFGSSGYLKPARYLVWLTLAVISLVYAYLVWFKIGVLHELYSNVGKS